MKFLHRLFHFINYLLVMALILLLFYFGIFYTGMQGMFGYGEILFLALIVVYAEIFLILKLSKSFGRKGRREKYITYDGEFGEVSVSTNAVESVIENSISVFEELESAVCSIKTKKDRKNNLSLTAIVDCVVKEEILKKPVDVIHDTALEAPGDAHGNESVMVNHLEGEHDRNDNTVNSDEKIDLGDSGKETGIFPDLNDVSNEESASPSLDDSNSERLISAIDEKDISNGVVDPEHKLMTLDEMPVEEVESTDYKIIDVSSFRKIGGDLNELSEKIQKAATQSVERLMGNQNLSVNVRFVEENERSRKKLRSEKNAHKEKDVKEIQQKKSRVR